MPHLSSHSELAWGHKRLCLLPQLEEVRFNHFCRETLERPLRKTGHTERRERGLKHQRRSTPPAVFHCSGPSTFCLNLKDQYLYIWGFRYFGFSPVFPPLSIYLLLFTETTLSYSQPHDLYFLSVKKKKSPVSNWVLFLTSEFGDLFPPPFFF